MPDEAWLRIVSMACATVMVVSAASLAAVGTRRSNWWSTLGALAVALAIVYVAYRLFRTSHVLRWNS